MTKMIYALCVCVLNLLQDIHQFACRQIDAYLSQARAPKNTHHYILITLYILITSAFVKALPKLHIGPRGRRRTRSVVCLRLFFRLRVGASAVIMPY